MSVNISEYDAALRALGTDVSKFKGVVLSDLKIRTKDKRLITYVPKPIHATYLDKLSECYPPFNWRRDIYTLSGVRDDILKSRQIGWSTLWLALYFIDTINTPLTQTIIVAHDTESTERLFQIVKRFYDNLPPEKQRPTRYSNRRELHFEDIDSVLFVGTAGAKRIGRGGTINNCHESERSFWEDGDTVEAALLEAVPINGNVTKETTANGLNDYYKEYQEEKAGNSVFRPRFFGWNNDHENTLTETQYQALVPSNAPIDVDGEEAIIKAYSLSEGQIRWRRWKKLSLKEKFPQEYPIDDIEAFIASGNPAFNRDYLFSLLSELNGEGRLEPFRIETPGNSAFNATVKTYREPSPSETYMVIADPSEGLDDFGNHDFAVAHVYSLSGWEQVCHYRGRPDPHNFGIDLSVLGHIYNNAMIVVLRNNHGHSTLNTLMNHCRYPNIYYHRYFDDHGIEQTPRAGYPETPRSKPEAVDDLTSIIEDMAAGEKGFLWREPNTVEELIHYVKKQGNKTGNEAGCHDDEVSCCYVGAAVIPLFAKGRRVSGEEFSPRRPQTANASSNRMSVGNRFGPGGRRFGS